jgi:putative signal transducing protein
MRDGWIVLRTFTNDLEAQAFRSLLEARGLAVLIEVDNCGGMRPHFDYTMGIKLMVPEQDADQARELIQAADQTPQLDPWTCGGCGETIDSGFDTCWKCGRNQE